MSSNWDKKERAKDKIHRMEEEGAELQMGR